MFSGHLFMGLLYKRGRSTALFIILAVLNVVLVVPELILRAADFRYESGISYGALRPSFQALFVPDKDLFWKLSPSDPQVNSLGFPGKEVVTPKPKHVFRIVYFGDSCTQEGYARMVERLLNEFFGGDSLRFECITMAVSGYSSYQGRVMAEMYGEMLEPDLVVVLFGWNDHWLAYRAIDSETHSGDYNDIISRAYHNLRLLQFMKKTFAAQARSESDLVLDEVRVSLDEYRENLTRISDMFTYKNVPVIFLTSPTSHYRLGVPEYLTREKLTSSAEADISLHRKYNQVVRDLAEQNDLLLLDLETDFDSLYNLDQIFTKDGIHFTPTGLELVAKRVYEFVAGNLFADKPAEKTRE
jgi:lysophospholipase L1-like esterase